MYYSSGTTSIITASPTLECAKGVNNTYSRYTSKLDSATKTRKGVEVNNDLNYPIALLSGDELIMAGAWGGSGVKENKLYYLYDAYKNGVSNEYWWTMTPSAIVNSIAHEGISYVTNNTYYNAGVNNQGGHGVRPVINLKADNLISDGDGSYLNPYNVVLP